MSDEQTPAQLAKQNAKFSERVKDFAARYPYVGWILVIVVAPYLFWRAYKEAKKP